MPAGSPATARAIIPPSASAGTSGAATGHRDTHTRPGRPSAECLPPSHPPLWTRRRSGICRWGAHQARLTPAPDMHPPQASAAVFVHCRPLGILEPGRSEQVARALHLA